MCRGLLTTDFIYDRADFFWDFRFGNEGCKSLGINGLPEPHTESTAYGIQKQVSGNELELSLIPYAFYCRCLFI